MRVQHLMTREVNALGVNDTLHQAADIMWKADCGCVPIVDEDRRLLGIVTDRDLCMASFTRGLPLHEIRIGDVMTRNVHTCRPDDSCVTAAEKIKAYQVHRLPVIDPNGRLVGLVSLSDLAVHYDMHKPGKRKDLEARQLANTLAGLCKSSARPRTPPFVGMDATTVEI